MKIPMIVAILPISAGVMVFDADSGAADILGRSPESFDATAEYAAIENGDSKNAQEWFDLAVRARDAGDSEAALKALIRAERLNMSPIRVGLERARIHVSHDDFEAALDELLRISEGGFTAVSVITNDPVLNRLSGRIRYDALVDEMSTQAYPCEHQDRFREFDFWLGEWDVHTADGTLAGRNRIEKSQAGCVLVENWLGASGVSGMSMNYLDMATGEWVQVWTDAGGTQIAIRGGLSDEGMLLEGHIHDVAGGRTAPFRGLWTILADGRVRQFFEESRDGGETWAPWFEGFYTRVNVEQQASEN